MTDEQSMFPEDVTMQVPHIHFFKAIIKVCKENQDLLPSLPEAIECLLENGSTKLIEINEFEQYRKTKEEEIMAKDKRLEEVVEYAKGIEDSYGKKERELEEKERGFLKKEEDMARKENEINERAKQLEESFQKKERELQKLKEEISKKGDEITKREKGIIGKQKKHEEVFQKMQNELQEAKEEVARREDEKIRREKEIIGTEKKREEVISKLNNELTNARMKMDSYKSRLASLSERHVRQDQRKVEDTLASNRQSDLEKEFSSFIDHDRLDACDQMLYIYQKEEENFTYIFYPRLACIILEVAYELVKEARNAFVDSLKVLTKEVVQFAPEIGTFVIGRRKSFMEGKCSGDPVKLSFHAVMMEEPSKFPKEAVDGMLLSLKENAECCNLDKLMEGFIKRVLMKWDKWCEEDKSCLFTPAEQVLKGLNDYVKACLRLSWRIVTQVPPMKLEYQTLKFNTSIHTKMGYYDGFKRRAKTVSLAQETQDEDIACYLWPALRDGGGRVIKAGEVLCVIQEEDKQRGNRPRGKQP